MVLIELRFRKTASHATWAINYLKGIFHELWLQFSVHFCSRAPPLQSNSLLMFSFLWILFLLKAFKTNFLICIVNWSLFWKDDYRLLRVLNCRTYIINHVNKVDAKPLTPSIWNHPPQISGVHSPLIRDKVT